MQEENEIKVRQLTMKLITIVEELIVEKGTDDTSVLETIKQELEVILESTPV